VTKLENLTLHFCGDDFRGHELKYFPNLRDCLRFLEISHPSKLRLEIFNAISKMNKIEEVMIGFGILDTTCAQENTDDHDHQQLSSSFLLEPWHAPKKSLKSFSVYNLKHFKSDFSFLNPCASGGEEEEEGVLERFNLFQYEFPLTLDSMFTRVPSRMKHFSFRWNTYMSQDNFDRIFQLIVKFCRDSVESINLDHTNVRSLKLLFETEDESQLKSLGLRALDVGFSQITDADVKLITSRLPLLESLTMPACRQLTAKSLDYLENELKRNSPKLHTLDIPGLRESIIENDRLREKLKIIYE
jgi:hypothetical protein